ncbi:unnamed protein product [Orchesella dallaii]|uniref:Uncharacterized protein n=1 Tax=Orchesella dallaii TaxID=48710 RepID=A0ABP1RKD5_9HEXA
MDEWLRGSRGVWGHGKVSVVQHTTESQAPGETVKTHETTDEHDGSWIIGESHEEFTSEESSSNKIPDDESTGDFSLTVDDKDHQDLHESQGQVEGKQWEAEATEPLSIPSTNENADGNLFQNSQENKSEPADDIIGSESNQDAQTVIIKPTRARNPKFQRRNRPSPTFQRGPPSTYSPSPYYYVPEKAEDTKAQFTLNHDGISIEALSEVKDGSETGSIVYSQRVTDNSAYQQPGENYGAGSVSTINEGTSTAAFNGKFRPRTPALRRKRPLNQIRNRGEEQEQQEEEGLGTNKKSLGEETPVVDENKGDISQLYGTSSSSPGQSPSSALHVAVPETAEEALDELGDERRVVSKLVRPKVGGLSRGRKKTGSVISNGANTLSSSSSSPAENLNSDGAPPTSDNSDQDKLSPLANGWTKDEHKSKATIGSESEQEGEGSGGEASTSANKVYNNTPTGKLIPFVPKIRPFNPKPKDTSYPIDIPTSDDDSISQGTTSGDIYDAGVDASDTESALSHAGMTVAAATTQSPPLPSRSNVIIRKVPIRRVKPSTLEKSETDASSSSSDTSQNSPIMKRIRLRRPNNSASATTNIEETPSSSTEQSSLDVVQDTQQPTEDTPAVPKIEKLDIRARLRVRNRNNKVATANTPTPSIETETESASGTSAELDHDNLKVEQPTEEVNVEASPIADDISRPVIQRKRLRRPMNRLPSLIRQGQKNPVGSGAETETETESTGYDTKSGEDSSQIAPPELPQQQEKPNPLKRLRRPPSARLSFNKNYKDNESNEDLSSSTSSPAIKVEEHNYDGKKVESTQEEAKPVRQRLRIPLRGNLRTPQPSPKAEESSAPVDTGIALEEDYSHTSESPVTVTSTYSRIRVNNKNSLLARAKQRPTPTYKKPSAVKEEVKSESDVVSTTEKELSYSPPVSNSNVDNPRTRFGVRTRLPSSKLVTTAAPDIEPEPELQKPGQLSQLDESSQEDRRKPQRKRVVIRRRRPQQNLQQENYNQNVQEEHLVGQYQENTSQEEYSASDNGEAGSSPGVEGAWNSDHVSSEEKVTLEPINTNTGLQSSPLLISERLQEQSAGLPSHSTDEVKIAEEDDAITGSPLYKHKKEEDDEGNDDDDDEDDDSEDDDEEYGKEKVQKGSDESEAYDLVLSQDKRKELGTQLTHGATQFAHAIKSENSESLESATGDEEAHHSSSPTYLESDQEQQNGKHETKYYAYGNQNKNYNINNDPSYSSIGIHQQSSYPDFQENEEETRKGSSGIEGFETLELGTPDYDPNPVNSYNDYGYGGEEEGKYDEDDDNDEEEEEESRIHMKVVDETGSVKPLALKRKGVVSQNEDKQGNISLTKTQAALDSSRESPVNPFNRQQHRRRPSENIESTEKDRNKRIRLKLRRPPSLYLNNSDGSTALSSSPTAAPFTPSLQSPRPTYAGHDALVESVTQSVVSLSNSENTSHSPNSQQLEQFIQNKKQAPTQQPLDSGRRNRTRIRVKLVTLPTTTVAPARLNTHDNDDDKNDSSLSTSVEASSTLKRPSFRFPPFQKSTLSLIATTEAPKPDATQLVSSYKPQKFQYRRPTTFATTTTTTTTTTETPPEINTYSTSNGEQYSSSNVNYIESLSTGNADAIIATKNDKHASNKPRITPPAKYNSQTNRFKVNAINQASNSYSHPSKSVEPSISPSTRKPQQRLKTPEFPRRQPLPSLTTEAPIFHQLPATTSSSLLYFNQQSPSQWNEAVNSPMRLPTPAYQPEPSSLVPEIPEEREVVPVRITNQYDDDDDNTNDVIDHENDTGEKLQIVEIRQQENVSPNSISYYEPSPPTKLNAKKPVPGVYAEEEVNPKGKYSSRFKVPEKFLAKKPNFPTEPQNTVKGGGGVVESNNGDLESKIKTKNPSYEIPLENTYNYAAPQQQESMQWQYQDYNNPVHTSIDFDLAPERAPIQQYQQEYQHKQHILEEEIANPVPEVVPDIRVNVIPFLSNTEVEQVAPTPLHQEFKAVPKHQEQTQTTRFVPTTEASLNPFSFAVKNSPYGPFPSTDHWSGIPTANSPVLPEFLDKQKPSSDPLPIRFESDTNNFKEPLAPVEPRPISPIRLEPNFSLRPQQVLSSQPIKNVIVFEDDDNYDEDYEGPIRIAPQSPPPPPTMPLPPVVPTVIRFGTDFEEIEEQVRVPHPPPILNIPNLNAQHHFINAPPPEQEFIHQVDENKKEILSHSRFPLNFHNQHQLGAPPQSHHLPMQSLPPNNMEFMRPQENHGIELQNRPLLQPLPPPMEPQLNVINLQRQPHQETVVNAIPEFLLNPVPLQHVSYEIKDGELIAHQQQQLPGQVGNEPPHHQLPPIHQNQNNHHVQFPELGAPQGMPDLVQHQQHQQQFQHQQEMVQQQQHQQQFQHQEEMVQQPQPMMTFSNNGQPLMEHITIQFERPLEHQPPQNMPQIMQIPGGLPPIDNNFKLERPLEIQQQPQPYKNAQLQLTPADHNIVVSVDGRPHDAPPVNQIHQRPNPMSQQQHFPKPMEHSGEEMIRGNQQNLKAFQKPARPQDNFPDAFDNHQVVKGREPVAQPPPPPPSSNENVKIPEAIINQGFADPIPHRPGQYGPPPPSHQRLPQYVPFQMMMNGNLQRNESEKQIEIQHQQQNHQQPQQQQQQQNHQQPQQQQQQHNHQQPQQQQQHQQSRPLIHHPQQFQGPVKYGNHQSFRHPIPAFNAPQRNNSLGTGSPSKFPPQFPQGHNSNFRNPPPNFYPRPNHYRAQPQPGPQMMMSGFPPPNGQFGNQHVMPRMRNPNARTSRAANLSAEVEKEGVVTQTHVEETDGVHDEVVLEYVPEQRSLLSGINSELPQQDQLAPNSENHEGNKGNVHVAPQPNSSEGSAPSESDTLVVANEKVEEGSQSEIVPDGLVSQRQQRQLDLDGNQQQLYENNGDKDDSLGVKSGTVNEGENQPEVLIMEESTRIENLADSSKDEPTVDPLMPTKWKNFGAVTISSEHKEVKEDGDSMESSESNENLLVFGSPLKSAQPSSNPEKRTLAENKKRFLMMKGVKEKNELQQQFLKTKPGKSEKGTQKSTQGQVTTLNKSGGENQEQQEFVAPKIIQRGFHPILPYSEKDPGPIVIQMLPKVEKFLPPPMDSEDGGGRGENVAPLPNISVASSNPIVFGTLVSNPFTLLQDPLLYSSNKHVNQVPLVANNFNTFSTNHPSQLRSLTYNTIT